MKLREIQHYQRLLVYFIHKEIIHGFDFQNQILDFEQEK